MVDRGDDFDGETMLGMGDSPTSVGVEDKTLSSNPSGDFEDEITFTNGLIGKTLSGKYTLKALVGQGGMGAVFEAEHVEIGNRVAIKVLFPEKRKNRESLARFRREARAAGTIGHPNIAKVFDIGQTEEGISYLVMEFVEGFSLADIVAREKGLDTERAVAVARQVLEALEAAHALGIVHRDIKPENVMVGRDDAGAEMVRVLDFGISKVRPMDAETPGLTQTGTILGTPMYMAPEQARGEADMDHRIDLYAVGAMMYVMISGHSPFQASNYNALLAKILTEEPPRLDAVVEGVDPRVAAVVSRAMAREREDRFPSARDFIDALDGKTKVELLPAADDVATLDVPPHRKILPLALIGSVIALVVVGLGSALVLSLFSGYRPSAIPGENPSSGDAAVRAPADAAPIKAAVAVASDAGGATTDGASAVPADPARITFRLTTEPETARVFLNGRLVDNPVEEQMIRADSETFVVRVAAEGFFDYTQTFPRTGDVMERIALKRRPVRGKRGPRPGTKRGNFKVDID